MRSLVVLGLVLAAAPARADDLVAYDVEGDADASGSDPRVAALDQAFARAVGSALADVLDEAARKTHKATLEREILARARLWVAKFTVTRDESVDGRRRVAVTVRIDRDKLRGRLDELAIVSTRPAGRGAVILVRVTDGDDIRASFGARARSDVPGYDALARELRGAGLVVQRGGGKLVELPASDDDARTFAVETRADAVVIAAVDVGPPTPLRGVPTTARLVTAQLRVVDASGKVVGQARGTVAATASRPLDAAIERAVARAAADALPEPPPSVRPVVTDDAPPLAEPGVVLVRLPARTPYPLVAAELKHLAGARGVTRATLRRLSPAGWVIGVVTAHPVAQIATIARAAPTAESTAQVKVLGDLVEVTLR